MKYTVGDISTPSTINYEISVNKGKLTIKNITLNTSVTKSNPIAEFKVAVNGNIVKTITSESETVTVDSKKAGNNSINLTGLNANGEIEGSMPKEYQPAVVN